MAGYGIHALSKPVQHEFHFKFEFQHEFQIEHFTTWKGQKQHK